jgi:hypothetical protein
MKWLNINIKVTSSVWWLIQGVGLLLNEIRVWLVHNYLDHTFLITSITLIVIACLLLIKNNKVVLLLGILLLLYSVFVLFAMGVLFFMEAQRQYILFAICLCFIIPTINIFLSVILLSKTNKLNS